MSKGIILCTVKFQWSLQATSSLVCTHPHPYIVYVNNEESTTCTVNGHEAPSTYAESESSEDNKKCTICACAIPFMKVILVDCPSA